MIYFTRLREFISLSPSAFNKLFSPSLTLLLILWRLLSRVHSVPVVSNEFLLSRATTVFLSSLVHVDMPISWYSSHRWLLSQIDSPLYSRHWSIRRRAHAAMRYYVNLTCYSKYGRVMRDERLYKRENWPA